MLTLTDTAAPAAVGHNSGLPAIKRLPAELAATIRRLVANRATYAALDKSNRADKTALLVAMDGAPAAVCEGFALTAREVGPVPASIKLNDGRTIPLAEIKGFSTKDGKRFSADDIASVFGGRTGYTDICVSAAN